MIWAFWHVLIFRELSVYSFIHSGYFYSAFFKPTTTQRRSQLLSNRSRLLAHHHFIPYLGLQSHPLWSYAMAP